MFKQSIIAHAIAPLYQWQGLQILPGLNAVVGSEGSGKTQMLRELHRHITEALWLDLRLPEHDQRTARQVWAELKAQQPRWSEALQSELSATLQLHEHQDKCLFMLSTGSRRKVGLVGLLASGAPLTCLDQPYAALDLVSVRTVRGFLQDMVTDPTRAWLIADHQADPELPWHSMVTLT